MRRTLFGLAVLLSSTALSAQVPQPANPVLHASVNGIRDPAHERELGIRRIDVTVELRGAVAEVSVDASFPNASAETLEGDFRLTLPPGAVVTGYALDIGGNMVDGVLVDRPRARAVYEARVRQRVDPGLAEIAPGNVFETRIHPILPGRERRIRVRFVAPVPLGGLRLPLGFAAPREGWSIVVHASGVSAAPAISLPGGGASQVTREADGYRATASGGNRPLSGELVIGRADGPVAIVSQHANGDRALQLSGDLPAAAASAAPARLRIYWDRSRSRLESRIDAEIDLARRAIEALRPSEIELVAFNSSGATRKLVGSAGEAAAWLKALSYRGATSFAPIATDGPADRCLLFSDGKPTVDRGTAFEPRCRLDTVSSAPDAEGGWLRRLAVSHGGTAVALNGDSAAALAAITSGQSGVLAVVDRDGRPLPFAPLEAAPGRWAVLVRGPEYGPITVRLAGKEVTLAADGEGARFDGAGALIAADQLSALTDTARRADYVALSRRFGVASPSLSFLVLETPADYLAAGVEMPATMPAELRDDYLRQRKALDASKQGQQQARLEEVVREWRDQVAWWRTKFDPSARPKRVTTSGSFDRTAPGAPPPVVSPAPIVAVPNSAPPPPPPPAPPPPPRESMMTDRAQNVVVTGARLATRPSARAFAGGGAAGVSEPIPAQGSAIQIDAWQPERPYLELYDGRPADFDERFLEAEKRHGSLPIFYLDTAEWLRKHGRLAEATEMALSALELPSANEVTLSTVADRLERYGAIDRAIELRERVAMLDPDRPQPRRLLALALARRAALQPAHAKADLRRAVELLYAIAITPQDPAWAGIELVALDEANALLPRLKALGGAVSMDPRLVQLLDTDLRVVIDWTTDGSDMDLWVDEPTRERAIYNNPRTAIGGHLSHDMTRGYGPEEYMLHVTPPGVYTVQANVYAPDRLDPNGPTLLTAHLFHDFGRAAQREESVDVELTRDERGAKLIGRMTVPAGGAR